MSAEKKELVAKLKRRALGVDFYVGLFAIIGMGCFAYLSINIAGFSFSQTGYYEVKAEFDNISGLKVNAPVEIAGVPIGFVSDIGLEDSIAAIKMRIENSVSLREDDIASIRTRGIIGEKFVRISPGASDELVVDGERMTETESVIEIEDLAVKIVHAFVEGDSH